MKSIYQMIEQMLKNYQRYHKLLLRLIVNDQSIYNGFQGEVKSVIEFEVSSLKCSLASDTINSNHLLEGIVIALEPVLKMNSKDELFNNVLMNTASEMDYMHLKEIVKTSQWNLVLIQCFQDHQRLMELVKHLLPEDTLLSPVENGVVVLFEEFEDKEVLYSIKDTLETELYVRISMAVSSVFEDIRDLPEALKEVIHLRKLMDQYHPSCVIADLKESWLLELIDSLSEKKSKEMLNSFVQSDLNSLDEELITTVQCFLENDLSISTTARKLYIHRNTLIYRLDKIAQTTGLDIRHFEDAVKLRFALLLNKK